MSGLWPAPNWNGYLYYSTGASQRPPSLTLPYRGRTGDITPGFTWPTDTSEFVIEYSKYAKGGILKTKLPPTLRLREKNKVKVACRIPKVGAKTRYTFVPEDVPFPKKKERRE